MRLRLVKDDRHWDWEGLYHDGKLVHQDHQIDWPWALRQCGIEIAEDHLAVEDLPGAKFPELEDALPGRFRRWIEEICIRQSIELTEWQRELVTFLDSDAKYQVAVAHGRSGGSRFVFDLFAAFARESMP